MSIFSILRKEKRGVGKSSLRLEIENLELELGIYHNDSQDYLYESKEYLVRLKESRDRVDCVLKKFPDIRMMFLQDPSFIIRTEDYHNSPEEYFLIDFKELEEEIAKDNESRDIILEDLRKLRDGKIGYEDIHSDVVQYLGTDFSCYLSSIISRLIGGKVNLPENNNLEYSQFYINNYRVTDLDEFPRSGPVWIGDR